MTPLIPARRAAEEFARVVDGSQVDVADRYADLTACVDLLREQEVPEPRAEFVADLRTRLMAAADTLLVPAEPALAPVVTLPPTRHRRRERRLATAAAALVLVGGTAGVAAAAGSALPGDALYPIKRGIESAKVTLSTSDSEKGRDLIAQAATRLDEVDALVREGDSASEISSTLASYQSSTTRGADLLFVDYQRGGDAENLGDLRAAFSEQDARLADLSEQAPSDSQDAFDAARSVVADLDQQARVLCGDCGADSGDFGELSSSLGLENLITAPAAAAAADLDAERAKELAEKAGDVASKTPNTPDVNDGDSATGGGEPLPGVEVPDVPSGDGGKTVATVTDPVEDLLDEVSSATGGATTPLTDTVNDTLDGVTGTVDGLLP